jgi:hypothetical protein
LGAIDRAGVDEEQLLGFAGSGEVQDMSCSLDDYVEHRQWLFGVESRAGLCGGMDDVRELTGRDLERPNVALV